MADDKNDGNISKAPDPINPVSGRSAVGARRDRQEDDATADYAIQAPDWSFWLRLDRWYLVAAISLLLEFDPVVHAAAASHTRSAKAGLPYYQWAIASYKAGKLQLFFDEQAQPSVDPVEWVIWAREKDIAIPEPLRQLISAEEKSVTQEKPLHAKERETLLRLVIGMAVKGYSYDPTAARSLMPSDIAQDLVSLGIGLDSDTVRKWLREAAELLPKKSEKP